MSDQTCCGACGYPVHATKEMACDWCRKSAARIEALTDKLAKAEAGLLAIAKRDEQMIWGEDYEVEEAFKDMRDIALATLAELKGGKDE
jgi:hypothetical protein